MVDVVAISLHAAAAHHGALSTEARIGPVLIERQRFVDPHPIDEAAFTTARTRPGADDVIANFGTPPDSWLASRKQCTALSDRPYRAA
jgi:hypothetical protein